ncbi:28S ribosomal protein S2, mitochondrial [Blomia tropicalis]|nr:28S ribosomal protein S2, mitochondrial [Blomia tropicalis]
MIGFQRSHLFSVRRLAIPILKNLTSIRTIWINKSLHTKTELFELEENDNLNYSYYDEICKKSLNVPDYFNVKRLVNINEMFDARVYMGHKEGTLNTYMKPYIFGSRLGHLIIDLDKTTHLLQEAVNFAAHIAFRNGVILFINKSPTTGHIVETTAKNCLEYSHCREWNIGTFTDSTRFFNAVTRLPDLLIFLSTMNNVFEQHPAVVEASKQMIPTIGVVDTNSNPCLITFPVPGNDDSVDSIKYFCRIFEEAIKIGKLERIKCLQNQ